MSKNKNNEIDRFAFLLAVSCLIHFLAVALYWWLLPDIDPSVGVEEKITIQLQARQQEDIKEAVPEEPVPEPEVLQEKPKDLSSVDPEVLPDSYSSEDVESSANQDNAEVGDLVEGDRAPVKKKKESKQVEQSKSGVITTEDKTAVDVSIQATEKQNELDEALSSVYGDFEGYEEELVDSTGDEEEGLESEYEIDSSDADVIENVTAIGNTKLLADSELSDAFVEDPISEEEAREVTITNRYLKAIWDEVLSDWNNPLSDGQIRQEPFVEIIFELNEEGSIRRPKVRVQSIFPVLDKSLIARLEALKDHKFDIHESYLSKYKYLRMRWAGSREAYELLPFEVSED